MLLNSRVVRAVHDVVGGEVDHSTLDEQAFGEHEKRERRLLALNLLKQEGWEPTLEFWQEPGTLMDTIVHTEAGGVTIYIAASMTPDEARSFTAMFLYCVPLATRTAARAARLADAAAALVPTRPAPRLAGGRAPPTGTAAALPAPADVPLPMELEAGQAADDNADSYRLLVHLPGSAGRAWVTVTDDTSVYDLKGSLAEALRVPQCELRLESVDGVPLGGALVHELGIGPGRELVARHMGPAVVAKPPGWDARKQAAVRSGMVLWVRTLIGKRHELRVLPEWLVEDVKYELYVEHERGLRPDTQRLTFSGVQLREGRTLEDCGVEEESTLVLVLRLVGC